MKKKKSAARYGLFGPRPLLALFLCAAAICSMIFTGTLLAFWRSEVPVKTSQTTLTFVERVAYQRAIEEVYWRHRIWPKDRPDPKPSVDAMMPQAQLEKKVQDYLRSSQMLADYLQQPLTAEQLQAEIDRMVQYTKQSEVLRELFAALGNDPFVIAECLARPVLVERVSQSVLASERVSQALSQPIAFHKADRASFRGYTLPVLASPSGGCTDDTWTPTSITNAADGRYSQTAVWTGSEMIVWGGFRYVDYLNTGGRYNPSTDSWTATSITNAPGARYKHTAVWTGSEMIVWGGYGDEGDSNTGGRYDPNTDSWTTTSATNAPAARAAHTAVWTGSEMIVWGGYNGNALNTGGRYNPSTDSWTAPSATNAPEARWAHTAVWTGREMIVWGGTDGINFFNTGGRQS